MSLWGEGMTTESSTHPSQTLFLGACFPSGILYHYLVIETKEGQS